MDYEGLEKLNKEFAIEMVEIQQEFTELFAKWMKKSPRTTVVSILSIPIGVIMNLMDKNDGYIEKLFPELPDTWQRYLTPWNVLRQKWGKIPSKQFIKEYGEVFGKQYEQWFPSEEERKNFEEWYRAQNKVKDGK